ncbi:MAG: hypothetical protein Q8Q09_11195 [Deltaproteobacteria bacterium]|nr:hypothetical protein [Deltaproteobacteria bacterium]
MILTIWTHDGDPKDWYLGIADTPIRYPCRPDALDSGGAKPLAQQFVEGVVRGLFSLLSNGNRDGSPTTVLSTLGGGSGGLGKDVQPVTRFVQMPEPVSLQPLLQAQSIVANDAELWMGAPGEVFGDQELLEAAPDEAEALEAVAALFA